MLNFGASKPRVKGGARAPGAPPGSAPDFTVKLSVIPSCEPEAYTQCTSLQCGGIKTC